MVFATLFVNKNDWKVRLDYIKNMANLIDSNPLFTLSTAI